MLLVVRKLVYILIGSLDRALRLRAAVTVLCYHSIADDGWPFGVDLETFKLHITSLKKTHSFITPQEFERYITKGVPLPKPAILLTFDDGYKNILTTKDFLESQGIAPLLFITSDPAHIARNEIHESLPLLSQREIRELIGAGWTIGSHSATHKNIMGRSEKELCQEILSSKTSLEKQFAVPIRYFAYPKGDYSHKGAAEVKKAGYTLGFCMDNGTIHSKTSAFAIPRIGVMRNYGMQELTAVLSPSVARVRKALKPLLGKRLWRLFADSPSWVKA